MVNGIVNAMAIFIQDPKYCRHWANVLFLCSLDLGFGPRRLHHTLHMAGRPGTCGVWGVRGNPLTSLWRRNELWPCCGQGQETISEGTGSETCAALSGCNDE